MSELDDLVWRAPEPVDAEALGRVHHRSWVDSHTDLVPPGWFDEHGPQNRIDLWSRVLAVEHPRSSRCGWCADRPAGAAASVDADAR